MILLVIALTLAASSAQAQIETVGSKPRSLTQFSKVGNEVGTAIDYAMHQIEMQIQILDDNSDGKKVQSGFVLSYSQRTDMATTLRNAIEALETAGVQLASGRKSLKDSSTTLSPRLREMFGNLIAATENAQSVLGDIEYRLGSEKLPLRAIGELKSQRFLLADILGQMEILFCNVAKELGTLFSSEPLMTKRLTRSHDDLLQNFLAAKKLIDSSEAGEGNRFVAGVEMIDLDPNVSEYSPEKALEIERTHLQSVVELLHHSARDRSLPGWLRVSLEGLESTNSLLPIHEGIRSGSRRGTCAEAMEFR